MSKLLSLWQCNLEPRSLLYSKRRQSRTVVMSCIGVSSVSRVVDYLSGIPNFSFINLILCSSYSIVFFGILDVPLVALSFGFSRIVWILSKTFVEDFFWGMLLRDCCFDIDFVYFLGFSFLRLFTLSIFLVLLIGGLDRAANSYFFFSRNLFSNIYVFYLAFFLKMAPGRLSALAIRCLGLLLVDCYSEALVCIFSLTYFLCCLIFLRCNCTAS